MCTSLSYIVELNWHSSGIGRWPDYTSGDPLGLDSPNMTKTKHYLATSLSHLLQFPINACLRLSHHERAWLLHHHRLLLHHGLHSHGLHPHSHSRLCHHGLRLHGMHWEVSCLYSPAPISCSAGLHHGRLLLHGRDGGWQQVLSLPVGATSLHSLLLGVPLVVDPAPRRETHPATNNNNHKYKTHINNNNCKYIPTTTPTAPTSTAPTSTTITQQQQPLPQQQLHNNSYTTPTTALLHH